MDTRLDRQIRFLIEIDRMKTILRQTLLCDKSRRENDAEHSWHFAVMAMVLYEYADPGRVNLYRVLKMALIHDLVEIYAGDTFAYDTAGYADKEEREQLSADRLFALLPEDQGAEIRALWEEFDAMETPDAKYASAMDRLQPLINNMMTEGHTWKKGNVSSGQVRRRMAVIREGAPALWPFVDGLIQEAVEKGFLRE